jgi:thioredoxin reductase
MVSMVRATIADPELPNKARRGAEERTRPCISTNEGCVGGVLEGSFGCVVNPEAGQEDLIPAVTTALRPAHVLVAGGGPAGLEAARVLASRGHRVSLFEMRRDLGGQVPIAASAPHRSDVAAIVSWLTDEITRLGVRIVRGTPVDPDLVRQLDPDAVIVATGSTPRRDGFTAGSPGRRVPGVHQPHVGTSWDLFGFGGRTVVGATAVVVDDTGTYEAVSVAEQLLAAGARTTLVTRHDSFGVNVPGQLATVLPARERLFAGDFELVSSSYLEEIGPATVTVRALAQGRTRVLDAETVVLVGYNDPDRELAEALAESDYSGQIHVVGDASGTRTLREAIRDGSMVARRLEGPLMPRSTSTVTGMPAPQ